MAICLKKTFKILNFVFCRLNWHKPFPTIFRHYHIQSQYQHKQQTNSYLSFRSPRKDKWRLINNNLKRKLIVSHKKPPKISEKYQRIFYHKAKDRIIGFHMTIGGNTWKFIGSHHNKSIFFLLTITKWSICMTLPIYWSQQEIASWNITLKLMARVLQLIMLSVSSRCLCSEILFISPESNGKSSQTKYFRKARASFIWPYPANYAFSASLCATIWYPTDVLLLPSKSVRIFQRCVEAAKKVYIFWIWSFNRYSI